MTAIERVAAHQRWPLRGVALYTIQCKLREHVMILFAYRELGAHVDGFIATAGHTLVIGSSKVNHY